MNDTNKSMKGIFFAKKRRKTSLRACEMTYELVMKCMNNGGFFLLLDKMNK